MISRNLIAAKQPISFVTENFKMLRTNINYLNYKGRNKTLMFTSSKSGEGKSTLISNLAITMMQEGKKVLIMDCDLRRPKIHELFGINKAPGLTNVMVENNDLFETIKHQVEGELDILTSGILPPSPDKLLASEAFKMVIDQVKAKYDLILIDAPPVLSVSDATIITQVVDGIIFVIAANETKKNVIKRANNILSKVEANIIGVALNKIKLKKHENYYDDYYAEAPAKKKRALTR